MKNHIRFYYLPERLVWVKGFIHNGKLIVFQTFSPGQRLTP